ncbi:MAG: DUF4832 domain-containing protein [Paludibacteraceae bacterium]|nr:DUF4832 domain-containing protein [Paludibacteraceae bacterium]
MNRKALLIILSLFVSQLWAARQNLDYTDGLEPIENPGIGFYRPQGIHLTQSGNKAASTWGNISHLRVDISEFSSNAPIKVNKESGDTTFGVSQPLTQDALDAFEATLDAIRQRGKTAIVRFAYDKNFSGYTQCDPDQSVILGHLKQLGEIYSRNTDVIQFVELGMYGSWGEMHSSHTGTNEHIAEALQTLLECTPPEIKIGVRRPDIVAIWLGVNVGNNYSGFDIDSETFHQAAQAKGDTLFRVGMYNDGYLGSSSDLGTIGMGASGHQMTREMMVKWLEQYSSHTPYGGELVANYNGDHPINTPDYLSQEGFRTHTSYLNYEWHQPTILGWKEMTYEGDEAEYYGKDGFTYVENHLGYRFILRESSIETVGNKIAGRLQIENVGFGNLTKKAIVSFVICRKGKVEEIFPDETIDPQTWLSRETSTINYHLSLPDDCTEGEYELFIRLSEKGDLVHDNNYHCIQFGNPSEQYDQSIGANLVGTLTVSDLTAMENIHIAKDTPTPVQYYNIKGERVPSASISDHQGELIIEMSTYGGKPVKKRVSVR